MQRSQIAGASYAWVSRAFGPVLGFFVGWAVLVAQAVFMLSGTVPAATATLSLIAPSLTANITAVTLVAAGWMIIISAVAVKGIKLASYVQVTLTAIEVAILVIIIVATVFHAWGHPAHALSFGSFWPGSFTPQMFASGALTAVFVFWGWDVALNLNEETRDAAETP